MQPSIENRIHEFKSAMLHALRPTLTARAFEVPGSDPALVSALAELLMFFSIGPHADRENLDDDVRSWWCDFCMTLARAGEVSH